MKNKIFEVVELYDGNRATILDICQNNYKAEIVNKYGIKIGEKTITDKDIKKIIYSK